MLLILIIPVISFAGMGPEFPCNTLGGAADDWYQGAPDVAMLPDGDFIVTWWSTETTDHQGDIFARRFHEEVGFNQETGQYYPIVTPLDNPEFEVNTVNTGVQSLPAVSINDSGFFCNRMANLSNCRSRT